MPKLKYVADWSDDDESLISETLHLNEAQEETLFVKKESIIISREDQAKLVAAMNAANNDDDKTDTTTTTPADTHNNDDDRDAGDKTEGETVDVSIVTSSDRTAIEMGHKLSKQTSEHIARGADINEEAKITSLRIFQDLRSDLKDEMAGLPVPNSRREKGTDGVTRTVVGSGDTLRVLSGNDTWDKSTYYAANDKGKPVKKSASFFKSMFLASAIGIEWTTALDAIDKAIASLKPDSSTTCPAEYKGFKKPKLARRKSLYESRISFGQTQLKKAVDLDKQCRAFDSLSQVDYKFETETVDGKEVFVNRNEPVQIYKIIKESGKEFRDWQTSVTILGFLKYDVELATKAAGGAANVTWEHLTDTVKRDKPVAGTAGKTEDWSRHEIGKQDEAINLINSLVSYYYVNPATDDVQDKRVTSLHTAATKDKETLLSLGDLAMLLDDWYTKNKNEYIKAQKERLSTALQEKAAKDEQRKSA